MYRVFLLLILGIFVINNSYANNNSVFDKGNQLYGEGEFEKALEEYKKIIDSGHESAELYYNMGNACYKSLQYTWAILFYEKALRLAPKDEDIKANLELVRKYHVTDDIEIIPEVFINKWFRSFRKSFSADTWAYASVVAFILFLVLAGLYLFSAKRGLKKMGFGLGIVFFLISVFAFNYTQKSRKELLSHNEAIIFTPSVIIKSSPDQNGKELFTLHEGTKVSIKDESNNYFEIRIADGNVGWLLKTDVKKI